MKAWFRKLRARIDRWANPPLSDEHEPQSYDDYIDHVVRDVKERPPRKVDPHSLRDYHEPAAMRAKRKAK